MEHSKPVRLKTAPTGGGESVYLFLEFTIILRTGQVALDPPDKSG